MLPLWIDTDASHDDALALLLASALPCFDLLGVSTTYGPVSLDSATRNAHSLLTALQAANVHVFPGEEKPSVGLLPPQDDRAGLRGSGLLPLPLGPRQPDHSALQALSATVQQHPPRRVCVCCLGPLTNLAAFVLNNPTLVPLLDVISISAGVDDCNLKADPYATEIVMNLAEVIQPHVPPNSAVPQIFVCPANNGVELTHESLQTIKKGVHADRYTVFRQMLFELLTYYADSISPKLCDPLAVLALVPQRLHADAGVIVRENGEVAVTDEQQLWGLIHDSIDALETSEV